MQGLSSMEDVDFDDDRNFSLTSTTPVTTADDDGPNPDSGDDGADGGQGGGGPGGDGGDNNALAMTLTGTAGDDVLRGNDAGDSITGLAGNDQLRGGDGADSIDGGAGDDFLRGGKGDDVLTGGDGNDFLRGEAGNDTLDGGAGDDTLDGCKGVDMLTGGQGNDMFLIHGNEHATSADGLTHISDFTTGADKLAFDDDGLMTVTAANFSSATATTFADALAAAQAQIGAGTVDFVAVQLGADVIVFADEDNTNEADAAVVLVGKSLSDIAPGDII